MRIGSLGGLRISFLAIVDGFRGGSLAVLLVGLRASFLALVESFRGGSHIGFLVRLRTSFPAIIDGFYGGSRIKLLTPLIVVLLIGLGLSFLTLVASLCSGYLNVLRAAILVNGFYEGLRVAIVGLLIVFQISCPYSQLSYWLADSIVCWDE